MNEAVPGDLPRKPVRRRGLLLAGVAAGAAAAGAGLALWRTRLAEPADDAAKLLWPLNFQTPQGSALAMASLRGRPLLVNFWATWCPPCVEELPMLDAFYRQQTVKGWQVVGLAIDQPSAVRSFLQRTPVNFPIGLAGLDGPQLARDLGNLNGGLPFTVVLGADGTLLQRRMGKIRNEELTRWAALA
ncbi:MAG: TlpA disulfide reductase family protein [Pseudomonadota bacterium]